MNPKYALDVKEKWAALLLGGYKTVELRGYPLPDKLLGQPIYIAATPQGEEGVAVLGDTVPAGCPDAQLVGVAVFSANVTYTSEQEWADDFACHQVPAGTPYGWQAGETTSLIGWRIHSVSAQAAAPAPAMTRYLRSIYTLDTA